MAKRFADSDKYKKPFIRSLPAPYKILWDYICLDCNHAGVWHKDFQIAQIYIGQDAPVTEVDALRLFNADEVRIVVLNHGSRWLIKPFIEFQYGELNPANRVHHSVLEALKKEGIKPLISPLQGAMDKDKDKDKDKDRGFEDFFLAYPKKKNKGDAEKAWRSVDKTLIPKIMDSLSHAKRSKDWVKDEGKYIPYPASWIRAKGWEDEHTPAKVSNPNRKLMAAPSV